MTISSYEQVFKSVLPTDSESEDEDEGLKRPARFVLLLVSFGWTIFTRLSLWIRIAVARMGTRLHARVHASFLRVSRFLFVVGALVAVWV